MGIKQQKWKEQEDIRPLPLSFWGTSSQSFPWNVLEEKLHLLPLDLGLFLVLNTGVSAEIVKERIEPTLQMILKENLLTYGLTYINNTDQWTGSFKPGVTNLVASMDYLRCPQGMF